jgi:uncharacterized CHY-type Zn-finger protein
MVSAMVVDADTLRFGGSAFVRERTCQQVDVTGRHKPYVTHMSACSLCGETLAVDEYHAPNFCPNCGAKVVER